MKLQTNESRGDASACSLDDLMEELTDRLQRNEHVDLGEVERRYPQYIDRVRRIWSTMQAVSLLVREDPNCAAQAESPQRLGDFLLLRELGRGGMGIVYEARQISLGRHVALKILPQSSLFDGTRRLRFLNEVRAAACLQHPHIVPVYQLGEVDGIHFFAMQLIDGSTLSEIIRWRRTSTGGAAQELPIIPITGRSGDETVRDLPTRGTSALTPAARGKRDNCWWRQVADWGRQIATALEESHRTAILHRDVKPSNIMIDTHGQAWLMDFGLAQVAEDFHLTMTGGLVGTLRYMSPEQLKGEKGTVDHRCDIFCLGATLYELLTLHPVRDVHDQAPWLRPLAEQPVTRPRTWDGSIPRELEAIVLRALEIEPSARYPTAAALAEDLANYLAERPVHALAGGWPMRVRKWISRNRRTLRVPIAVAVTIGVFLATARWQYSRMTHQREKGRIELAELKQVAETQHAVERNRAYGANIVAAALGLRSGATSSEIRGHLELCRPPPGELDLRGLEWQLLWNASHEEQRILGSHSGMAYCVGVSPDGRRIASAGEDGICIWDGHTGDRIHLLPITPTPGGSSRPHDYNTVEFSPDGRYLAGSSDDGQAYIWDTESWQLLRELPHDGLVFGASFSPDGQCLVTADRGHVAGENGVFARTLVRVWSWREGALLRTLEGPSSPCQAFALSPDGKWAAVVGDDESKAYFWDVASGQLVHEWENPTKATSDWSNLASVTFSGDSEGVVVGADTGALLLGRMGDRGFRQTVPSPLGYRTESVAFSSDGTQLAAVSRDGFLAVFDVAPDFRLRLQVLRACSPSFCVQFLKDHELLTTGRDGSVRHWTFHRLRFEPCGAEIMSQWDSLSPASSPAWEDARAKLATVADWPMEAESPGMGRVIFTHDSSSFMCNDAFWGERDSFRANYVTQTDLQPPIRLLATGEWLGTRVEGGPHALLVEPRSGAVWLNGGQRALAASPDGTWIATTSEADVSLFHGRPPRLRRKLPAMSRFAFGPQGSVCAGIGLDGVVSLWESPVSPSPHAVCGKDVRAVCFSPDGTRLAGCTANGDIFIWLVVTGRELLSLTSPFATISYLRFSSDGCELACSGVRPDGTQGTVKLSAGGG